MEFKQLIDIPLWDRARWKGVAFGYDPRKTPFMALLFTERDAALEIFKGLHAQLGNSDEQNLLRIAFIEGDIPGEDAGYTVHVGMNDETVLSTNPASEMFLMVSRVHRMKPARDSPHLTGFKREFARQHRYLLASACLSPRGELLVAPEDVIQKQHVVFKHVTEIGPNDIDRAIFVREEDSPKH